MAFNFQTFKTRTITSIVFVVVMLAGLLWNQWSFFILFSIIHFGCWWEYQKLMGIINKGYQQVNLFHKYGVMIAGWLIMIYFSEFSYDIFDTSLSELGLFVAVVLFFAVFFIELAIANKGNIKNIGHSVFGLIYISLSLGLMMDLYLSGIFYYKNSFAPCDFCPSQKFFQLHWSISVIII